MKRAKSDRSDRGVHDGATPTPGTAIFSVPEGPVASTRPPLFTDLTALRLDVVHDLHRTGALAPPAHRGSFEWSYPGGPGARLDWKVVYAPDARLPSGLRVIGASGRESYVVELTWTPCFGSSRAWFRCPRCHSRRRYLYLDPPKQRLQCRDCAGLVYRSRQGWGVAFFMAAERPLGALFEAGRASESKRASKRKRRAWERLERVVERARRYERALGLGR